MFGKGTADKSGDAAARWLSGPVGTARTSDTWWALSRAAEDLSTLNFIFFGRNQFSQSVIRLEWHIVLLY